MTTFLERPSRFLFLTAKGGVGKTALACATAIRLADAGKRILLVSTDPASNLDQTLGERRRGKDDDRHATRVATVPWVTEEPVGSARLLALARGTSLAQDET